MKLSRLSDRELLRSYLFYRSGNGADPSRVREEQTSLESTLLSSKGNREIHKKWRSKLEDATGNEMRMYQSTKNIANSAIMSNDTYLYNKRDVIEPPLSRTFVVWCSLTMAFWIIVLLVFSLIMYLSQGEMLVEQQIFGIY